ncbi:MAG: OmpA family protein [Shewanella xiamenensis]
MLKYKLICLAVLPFSFSAVASETSANLPFQSYWYAGAGLGQGHYSNGRNPQSYDSVRDRFAGSVYLGYQVNHYLAPELSYQFLGIAYANYEQGQISGDFQQVVLAARFGYPLRSSLYPYVKVGGAGWFGDSDGVRSGSEQGFSPIAAAGVEYAFTPRLSGRLEYQYTDSLGADSIGHTDHHLTTFGLNWRFGYSAPFTPPVPEVVTKVIELPPVVQTVEKRQFVYSEQKGNSLFAHNSSVLENTSQFTDVASFLKQHPSASAVIKGHTDSTGSDKYNLWLSERRAAAVVNYFISQGVKASQLTAIGEGSAVPATTNTTEAGRAMNRRVEIIIPEFTVMPKVK